jgi:hypothetical protein
MRKRFHLIDRATRSLPALPIAIAAAALAFPLAPAGASAKATDLERPTGELPLAHSYGTWQPGRFDSCPAALHDRYATRGPDGKLYPGWHPPAVRDPETGRRCTFGHEHGRDPRGSDLYRWVAGHLGGGLPFGAATEALDAYAAANPGVATRHEDHVGHKVEWQNDVALERRTRSGRRRKIGVTCDFLTKIHQGTHSADAFANNVHELIYAVRCNDGTRLLTTTLARFSRPNTFGRSCRPRASISAGTALRFPAGRGARLIPDRVCIDRHLLVPAGRFSLFTRGLYEDWISSNRLTTRGGRQIAYWDPHFAVFNPARYFDASEPGGLRRTLDLCWERTASGERAAGSACDRATDFGRGAALPFDDPRSPFDGTHRETYLNQTVVANRHGPHRWYTDPYGRDASRRSFPGALCQLVSATNNGKRPTLESQAFGGERPYSGRGVHAPN